MDSGCRGPRASAEDTAVVDDLVSDGSSRAGVQIPADCAEDEYGSLVLSAQEEAAVADAAVAAAERLQRLSQEKATAASMEAAAAEQQKRSVSLEQEIAKRTVLAELKASKGNKRGRYSKAPGEARKKAISELKDLNAGFLPGEKDTPRKLSREEVLDSAGGKFAKHVAGPTSIPHVGCRGGRIGTEDGEKDGDATLADADDCCGSDDEEEDQDAKASYYYNKSEAAKSRIKEVTGLCASGCLERRQSPVFEPNDPIKSSSSTRLAPFATPRVYVHAPHLYFASRGIPSQPPCPTCGWKAVDDRNVVSNGWTTGRRVSGIMDDEFMVGTRHICKLCKQEREVLQVRADEWKGDAAEKERRLTAVKSRSYIFRSYDPAVTKLYTERFPWVGASMRVVVCTHKTAMSVELALLVKSLITTGSSPHAITKMLQKMKGVQYTLDQTVYYGYQQFIRSEASPLFGQPTLRTMFEREKRGAAMSGSGGAHEKPEIMTRKDLSVSVLSHQVLRRFFVEIAERKVHYEAVWREDNVWSDILQVDHTLKVFRDGKISGQKVFTNRATVWASSQMCPALSMHTSTTSFDDPALKRGCEALMLNFDEQMRRETDIKAVYLDNPNRDGPGARRLFKLSDNVPAGVRFSFSGKVDLVRTEEGADAAVLKLGSAKVVGLDMDWHAPCVRGIGPSKTLLIQVCSSAAYCAIFVMADLGMVLPGSLRAFLCNRDVKKVGNNISGDFTKLRKDFDLDERAGPFCELTSFTSTPTARRSLADLVTMVSGKEMDKGLGKGALSDWTAENLSDDQVQYAACDAWAGLFVWQKLVARQAGPAQMASSSPVTAAVAEAGGCEPPWDADIADVLKEGDGEQKELDLSDELRAEVTVGLSPMEWLESGGDGDSVPAAEEPPSVADEVALCLLQKAKEVIDNYAGSGRVSPLRLPPNLTSSDRSALHAYAEARGLDHRSAGDAVDQRHLVISKRQAAQTFVTKTPGCNPHWMRGKVKYDMRHFMANFFLMAIGKDSSLFKYFCVAVSDAVYKIIPSSRAQVRAHLKFLGLSNSETRRVRRKYWRTKARYWVPGPETLVQGLTDVYDFFKDVVDPTTGRNFFIADHAKRFRHEMSYVRRGDLSDPPGVAMYTKVGEFKSGLARFICLRSSSAVEGYHLHLRLIVPPGAKKASLRWHADVTNAFDFRWCVRALRALGFVPQWIDHYDLELYDVLYDITLKLGLADQVLPMHRRTSAGRQPRVRHGLHFALAAQEDALRAGHELVADEGPVFREPSSAPVRPGASGGLHASLLPTAPTGVYFAHKLGLSDGKKLRKIDKSRDVKLLLKNREARDNPATLTVLALRHDILLLQPGARAFVKEAAKDVAAWDLLVQKEYLTLQERLRCDAFHAPDDVAQISKPLALPLPLSAVAECCEDEQATTSAPLFVGLAAEVDLQLQLDLADATPFETREPEPENDGLGVPSTAPTYAVVETVLHNGSTLGDGGGGEVVASHVQVAPDMQALSAGSQSGDRRQQAVVSMKEVVVPSQVQQGAESAQEVVTRASACASTVLVPGGDGTTLEQSGVVVVGLKRAVALTAAQRAKKYRARKKKEGR